MRESDWDPLVVREERDQLLGQRGELLAALKSLRSLIRDLGVQDADDAWYEAVERADVVISAVEGRESLQAMQRRLGIGAAEAMRLQNGTI